MIASISAADAQNILSMRDTITDPSFVFPQSYEADTHKMQQDWYLTNYTSLDRPSRATVNTPVNDEEYIRRLQAMPTEVEMVFNSIVKSCIEMYVERRRGQVERMLGMSTYYMPLFEQALEQEGVPLELRYLPIIESALDPNAVSRAGATGLWQFMLPTARGLGLEISSLVDERRDPVKSSQMAARYLKQLHDIYDDWSLAIAAYNCGPGNVNKALKRAGEGKKDFWEIYPYLPRETRGYLPGFIAANYAMNYYAEHGISPVLAKKPVITDSVHVNKRVHFQQIAEVLNIPVEEIRMLNPQYRKDVIPGDVRPYPLVLPSHQTLAYIMSEDSIVAHNAQLYARRGLVEPSDGTTRVSDDGNYIIKEVIKYHKVRRGETFSAIARRYGVTVASIKRANGIKTLRRGRTIKIITTERIPRPVEETPADTINVGEETIPVTFDAAADSLGLTTPATPGSRPEVEDPSVVPAPETTTAIPDSTPEADAPEAGDTATEDKAEVAEADEAEVAPELGVADANEAEVAPEAAAVKSPASTVAADTVASEADRRIRDTFSNRRRPAQPEAAPAQVEESKAPVKEEVKPTPRPKPKAEPKPQYVKVKKGDTMSKIARRNSTTVKKLERLNPNVNPARIKPGDRIRIK